MKSHRSHHSIQGPLQVVWKVQNETRKQEVTSYYIHKIPAHWWCMTALIGQRESSHRSVPLPHLNNENPELICICSWYYYYDLCTYNDSWARARSHLHSGGSHTFPRLLHCPVFLPASVWELFPVGNQCDNTRSLKLLSSFDMWRNFIN